jgi:DNA-directed RNA polymerase II subunit RPB3
MVSSSRLLISERSLLLTYCRPESENVKWEEPAQEGEPFDYDAVPDRFYFEVESVGNLEPDAIIQSGIKVLQEKLASVIAGLTGEGDGGANGADYEPPRSPDIGLNGGANGGGWDTQGYTTPFGAPSGGGWGATGGATPYGATPYGQSGTWN